MTGSSGHLAKFVIPLLEQSGHEVIPFDLPEGNVMDRWKLGYLANGRADFCVHLAGLKYADRAELEPLQTVDINVTGTANVVHAFGSRVALASTCKAADPETVYGSTKLIAERVVLAAGGRVARFVNVLGSAGSVTDIWAALDPDAPLPVCEATRLFIGPEEASELIVNTLEWPSGRYGPHDPERWSVTELAAHLYPERPVAHLPLRRGDRRNERLLAECEYAENWRSNSVRIIGQHDPKQEGIDEFARR